MVETQVKELLEAGVHFGHQASRWNPKMRKFIFVGILRTVRPHGLSF